MSFISTAIEVLLLVLLAHLLAFAVLSALLILHTGFDMVASAGRRLFGAYQSNVGDLNDSEEGL